MDILDEVTPETLQALDAILKYEQAQLRVKEIEKEIQDLLRSQ